MTQTDHKGTGVSAHVIPGAPLQSEPVPDACTLVIFGATGDLTKRKLIPALYNLKVDGLLPENYAVLGIGRRLHDLEAFRDRLREGTEAHSRSQPIAQTLWSEFAARCHYLNGDLNDPQLYLRLREQLDELDKKQGTCGNRMFYLAVPASSFPVIIGNLKEAGLIYDPKREKKRWSRVVIEKPFGRDLETARELNELVGEVFDESQIFRIDHYLGKETVQNILVFRFGNAFFEPLWNRKYVDHVEITAGESIGVGERGRFYDETGALRDMVQSHLLQVLALCAMEPPVSFAADDVRDEKTQVFRSLRQIIGPDVGTETVRGQYRGYTEEPNVAPDSRTPTYVALKIMIDNWRWQGVPFYVRSGKKLAARCTEIAIYFNPVPLCLFGSQEACQRLEPNVLTLRIQPDEGISLRFASKAPGESLGVASVDMDFSYAEAFDRQPQEAYERLLLDCMRNDATLFWRRDSVEYAWKFVTPILEAWKEQGNGSIEIYEPGSDGPKEADALLLRDRHHWRPLQ